MAEWQAGYWAAMLVGCWVELKACQLVAVKAVWMAAKMAAHLAALKVVGMVYCLAE